MTEEAKQAKREYMKAWREKNREHCLEYHRSYRASHKDQVRETNQKYWEKRAQRLRAEADQTAPTSGEGEL